MNPKKKLLFIALGLAFLISGCGNDAQKDDYSGISGLISDRNKARHKKVDKSSGKSTVSKKNKIDDKTTKKSNVNSKKEELSSIVLYEENVQIVNSKSQRVMAKGVAYLNKKGQIVKLKILKK